MSRRSAAASRFGVRGMVDKKWRLGRMTVGGGGQQDEVHKRRSDVLRSLHVWNYSGPPIPMERRMDLWKTVVGMETKSGPLRPQPRTSLQRRRSDPPR